MGCSWSEFEEKEYEIPLYLELLGAPGRLWSPGQVLEHQMGIDCALSAGATYWKLVRRRRKPGIPLQGLLVAAGLRRLVPTPGRVSFSVNLLVQTKRCMVYDTGTAPRHQNPTVGTWYCLRTDREQQRRLRKLDRAINKPGPAGVRADVCYAAPCFARRADLWSNTRAKRLVERSTFPLARDLGTHRRWGFHSPGASGVGLSKPARVIQKPLMERLNELIESHGTQRTEIVSQLEYLDSAVCSTLPHLDSPADLEDSHELSAEGGRTEAFLAARIAATLAAAGITWFVAGRSTGAHAER